VAMPAHLKVVFERIGCINKCDGMCTAMYKLYNSFLARYGFEL